MSTLTFDDVARLMRELDALNPIEPRNRNVARLQPSPYVERGSVYRVQPYSLLAEDRHPLVVMHPDDIAAVLAGCPGMGASGQWITDTVEQWFADNTKATRPIQPQEAP